MTELQALIHRMADELDNFNHPFPHPLAAEARAALAEPQGEGECPACEGTPKPGNQPCAVCGRHAPPPADGEVGELVAWLRSTRAARLTRAADLLQCLVGITRLHQCPTHGQQPTTAWGCPECVHELREEVQRLSPPQPIPVSERLPGPGDCDAEGKCWWGEPQIENSHDATWNFCTQSDAEEFCTWGTKCGWLPAHALPVPTSEVQP